MSNFIKSYQANVGLNHVPAYQVSGQPFASGSIDASSGAVKVEFPYVTRWIYIQNNDTSSNCRVGFSREGVENNNFFTIHSDHTHLDGHSPVLELKVSEIWLSGSNPVDVVAGLTSIPTSRTATDSGPNWSGSAGVG